MSITSKVLWSCLALFLVLVCFGACLLVYMKPTQLWFYLRPSENDFTSDQTVLFSHGEFHNIQSNVTLVLIWLDVSEDRLSSFDCLDLNISSCYITTNQSIYNWSHAVIFHHRYLWWDLRNLPQQPRPLFQKWIWMNMESPSHSPRKRRLNHIFNLTFSYRRDADIHMPYGFLTFKPDASRVKVPPKNKLVCWVVSNRYSPERIRYYKKLKKYIKIHTYGKLFGRPLSWIKFMQTLSTCKFYLAFENSISKDYITEKIYLAFVTGSVPVVLGPPRKNYEDYILPQAFIHVDDFKSPKDLSDYLLMLDQNYKMYLRYFEWKKDFSVYRPRFWKAQFCWACDYIKKHPEYKSAGNLEEWFWNNSPVDFCPAGQKKENAVKITNLKLSRYRKE